MITTNRGLVLGSMGCTQRQAEVRVVDFAMRKLGVRIVARIPNIEGMTLEGGDFVGYNSGMLEIDTVPYKNMHYQALAAWLIYRWGVWNYLARFVLHRNWHSHHAKSNQLFDGARPVWNRACCCSARFVRPTTSAYAFGLRVQHCT
jgi:hypothetical protein